MMINHDTVRRRRSDGEQTHRAILHEAARIASVEGLHGLTIGRLADAVGVSKSGVYAHFGSKEDLQRETIREALAIFEAEVMEPAAGAGTGLAKIEAVAESYFAYLERGVFPGGCFFASILAESDARRGPIHDIVAAIERSWIGELADHVRDGRAAGEVRGEVDPEQVAFEVHACFELSNYHYVLFGEPAELERGRRAVRGILERARAP